MTQPGNAVALPANGAGYADGLEDMDSSDLTIPRLKIDHKKGVLKDGQTGQEFGEVYAVVLGLVKQRILWHPQIDNDEKPMCKSPDFQNGYPNLNPTKPSKGFPWDKAGLDPSSFPAGPSGLVMLPCEGCNLRNWGTHPMGDKPYCAEQHTLPMLYAATLEELMQGMYSPALFTVAKSGIKPSKNYLSPFAQRKMPVYSAITKLVLRSMSAGTNPYAVPMFSTVGQTDGENWPEYSERLRAMRDFLQSSRPRTGEESNAVGGNVVTHTATPTQQYIPPTVQAPPSVPMSAPMAPPMPPAAQAAAPAATATATAVVDEDDLPF